MAKTLMEVLCAKEKQERQLLADKDAEISRLRENVKDLINLALRMENNVLSECLRIEYDYLCKTSIGNPEPGLAVRSAVDLAFRVAAEYVKQAKSRSDLAAQGLELP